MIPFQILCFAFIILAMFVIVPIVKYKVPKKNWLGKELGPPETPLSRFARRNGLIMGNAMPVRYDGYDGILSYKVYEEPHFTGTALRFVLTQLSYFPFALKTMTSEDPADHGGYLPGYVYPDKQAPAVLARMNPENRAFLSLLAARRAELEITDNVMTVRIDAAGIMDQIDDFFRKLRECAASFTGALDIEDALRRNAEAITDDRSRYGTLKEYVKIVRRRRSETTDAYFRKKLADNDAYSRIATAVYFGEEAAGVLGSVARSSERPEVRAEALRGIGELRSLAGYPAILAALDEREDRLVRLSALEAAAKIRAPDFSDFVAPLLKDPADKLCLAAAEALESCGTVDAVEPLLEARRAHPFDNALNRAVDAAVAAIQARAGGEAGRLSAPEGEGSEGRLSSD